MKTMMIVASAAAVLGLTATSALAEMWVDYTPQKGVYMTTLVHVDPDKIDDYLVALKKTWVPGEELSKKHGIIDSYAVQINANPYGTGPNVVLIEHYPTSATLDPDKTRDMAIDKEMQQYMPKASIPGTMTERAKYRTIISQEMWGVVDFTK